MNPDTRSSRKDLPEQPNGISPAVPSHPAAASQQEAAANVLRGQIGALYGDAPVASPTPAQAAQHSQDANPYHRTHSTHPATHEDQWKAYHSAWQNYYQQYYAQYYTQTKQHADSNYFSQGNALSTPFTPVQPEAMKTDEALYDLRNKLLSNVQASAASIRKSRHFIPIVAALTVVLLFIFVQYNRVFISTVQAYVVPGNASIQNIVIDPSTNVNVGPEPLLIIPKINVEVPVIYDVPPDNASQLEAMKNGVAQFTIPGANSKPGQIGNTVLAGHSSNDLFDTGSYKFIFAQLERMQIGETIYANYKGVRYTYLITKTEVVKPTDVSKLVYPTDKPLLTLVTCVPIGTALNRLLVTAEQVSPDPAQAIAAPTTGASDEGAAIPGNSPTFIERLFGR